MRDGPAATVHKVDCITEGLFLRLLAVVVHEVEGGSGPLVGRSV